MRVDERRNQATGEDQPLRTESGREDHRQANVRRYVRVKWAAGEMDPVHHGVRERSALFAVGGSERGRVRDEQTAGAVVDAARVRARAEAIDAWRGREKICQQAAGSRTSLKGVG